MIIGLLPYFTFKKHLREIYYFMQNMMTGLLPYKINAHDFSNVCEGYGVFHILETIFKNNYVRFIVFEK